MIIPAILEKDFEKIREGIKAVEDAAQLIQIDVSDGSFTKDKTFTDIERLDEISTAAEIELHLMVEKPNIFVQKRVRKVVKICTHVEAEGVGAFLTAAKNLGYRVGLAINPESSLEKLTPYVELVDFVQFMTVTPGAQGQQFDASVLDKINIFKTMLPGLPVQVDGGIDELTLPLVLRAGALDVVVGSQIYQSPKESYHHFETELKGELAELLKERTKKKMERIAFLGGAGIKSDEQEYKDAYETAKLLAQNGYTVVNGGGPGIMTAATQGAHAGGSTALAVTYYPGYIHKNYEGVGPENKFDEEVVTLDYFDRTKVILQNSDIHIVFKGGTGTISEFGMTWASSRIHEGHHKPIILFGGFWKDIITEFKHHMKMLEGELTLIKIVETPQEVLDYVKSLR